METNIKAAIIMRTWYDAAVQELSVAERCMLYDSICAYTFAGTIPEKLPTAVAVFWRLVQPYLDEDRQKYIARCARNRENAHKSKVASGSEWQRVAASGSEWQRVADNTNSNNNSNTNNNNNNNNKPISPDEEERGKFDCYGIFISRGCLDCDTEFKTFWNYYEALGWVNNKGAKIVRKTAAATMWRISSDICANPTLSRAYWLAFKDVKGCPWWVWREFAGIELKDGSLTLYLKNPSKYANVLDTEYSDNMSKLMSSTGATYLAYTKI